MFEEQFACADQGLLQSYLFFTLGAVLLAPVFYFACHTLHRRQAHNDSSALFFAAAAFCGTRILLFSVHLLVYSRNGSGLAMLSFVAQLLDFLATTMVFLVMVSLVHGVHVTRPCILPGSEERRHVLWAVALFSVTYLLSTLVCGFEPGGDVTPFGVVSQGPASWPYALARAAAAAYCLHTGFRMAREGDALPVEKRQFLMKFGLVSCAWLSTVPLVVFFFAGEDTWRRDAAFMELANFFAYCTLLWHVWPSRFGSIFNCVKPSERMHPYAEFGAAS